jgi:hypothetical protein
VLCNYPHHNVLFLTPYENLLCRPHYNVNLKAIDVGGAMLQLPKSIFDTRESKGTIIDSGTTLAYLPEVVHKAILSEVRKLLC